jgi:hypothetical protein
MEVDEPGIVPYNRRRIKWMGQKAEDDDVVIPIEPLKVPQEKKYRIEFQKYIKRFNTATEDCDWLD